MPFQQSVQRQYTTGFVGDIVRDGPLRARVARILSAGGNIVGRAFGYSEDLSLLGEGPVKTIAADAPGVVVGGANFFGILFHPKHYASRGGAQGPLSPTLELPVGSEGEFTYMCTGVVVELANPTQAAVSIPFDAGIAYAVAGSADLPAGIEAGMLVAFTGEDAPAGFQAIPNARVANPIAIGASTAEALAVGLTFIELTQ